MVERFEVGNPHHTRRLIRFRSTGELGSSIVTTSSRGTRRPTYNGVDPASVTAWDHDSDFAPRTRGRDDATPFPQAAIVIRFLTVLRTASVAGFTPP
jgi:hypothetical protein